MAHKKCPTVWLRVQRGENKMKKPVEKPKPNKKPTKGIKIDDRPMDYTKFIKKKRGK